MRLTPFTVYLSTCLSDIEMLSKVWQSVVTSLLTPISHATHPHIDMDE